MKPFHTANTFLPGSTLSSAVFWMIVLGITLFSATTLLAGFSAGPPRPGIHGGFSGQLLHQVARPDLGIEDLKVSTSRQGQGRTAATITAQVRNLGKTNAQDVQVTCTMRGRTLRNKKIIRLRSIKAWSSRAVHWQTKLEPGKNTITLAINDPVNEKNNTMQKVVTISPPSKPHHAPDKMGKTMTAVPGRPATLPGMKPLKLHPDLAVGGIFFGAHSCKPLRPAETCVKVVIRNVGNAPAGPTRVMGSLRRGDGSTERNSLPVPALRAGGSTTITGPLRLAPGRNTLTMEVRDRYNKKNNRLTRSHVVPAHRSSRKPALDKMMIPAPQAVKNKRHIVPGTPNRNLPRPGPETGDPPAYLPDIKITSVRVESFENKGTPPFYLNKKSGKKAFVALRNIGGPYDGQRHPCVLTFTVNGPLGREPEKKITIRETITANTIERSIILPKLAAHGPYTVRVTAHLDGQRELRLDNNTMSKSFSVEALPDLAILLSQPNDVRVGQKRWFRLRVKNIGQAPSRPARLKLHINLDGDHYYDIPVLQPGEIYPGSGQKSIQRGVKWWKRGKKEYYAQILSDFPEETKSNNRIKSFLHVYLPKAFRFNPEAKVQYCPKISIKSHGTLQAGRSERLTFRIYNHFPQSLTAVTRFSLYLKKEGLVNGLPVSPEPLAEFEVGPLFPTETRYRTASHTFSLPGRHKIIVSAENKKHRNWGKCSPGPVEIGSFIVSAKPSQMSPAP